MILESTLYLNPTLVSELRDNLVFGQRLLDKLHRSALKMIAERRITILHEFFMGHFEDTSLLALKNDAVR